MALFSAALGLHGGVLRSGELRGSSEDPFYVKWCLLCVFCLRCFVHGTASGGCVRA
jgi:hypothetical protein